MLEEHPEMGDYLIFRFDSYGEYALKLYLYAYTAGTITAYTEYMRVKQDLLLKIAAIIKQHGAKLAVPIRSEQHTSELQSLMRISYAVFCLKNKTIMIQKSSKKTHKKNQ